jgi:molybdate transport repressor ModE-like protein
MSFDTHLTPTLAGVWRFAPDAALGDEAQLMALLTGIAQTGSIAAAARASGMSYRHAWGRIERWQTRLGQVLVDAGRGSGSRLTPFATRLLALDARIRKRLAPHLAAASTEMAALLAGQATQTAQLKLAASHDLTVAELAELLRSRGWTVDLRFRGSLEAVAALAREDCDAAGFHCPGGLLGRRIWAQYLRHLSPRKHELMKVCERVQGLMVAQGNPKQVKGLRDLARGEIRFLNRQQGAGTRMVLDLLLLDQGLRPEDVSGYTSEEHTHAAVAALIAGGAADAGLGIEAAARRFGLEFVPLVEETYYLAYRRRAARSPAMAGVAAALAGPEFGEIVSRFPGYRCRGSGEVLSMSAIGRSLGVEAPQDLGLSL